MAAIPEVRACIEEQLAKGVASFVIYPFGETGMQVKNVLKEMYAIEPLLMVDDALCRYNPAIKDFSAIEQLDDQQFCVILATINEGIYGSLLGRLEQTCGAEHVAELASMQGRRWDLPATKAGRHSYGPLCAHWLVESVGAFCSFAVGTDVVGNHVIGNVSTHPMLYAGDGGNPLFTAYETFHAHPWYIEGIHPRGEGKKLNHRITIGNDVWFGKNVTITNGANIGNGVIAGAGTIITKDVPDYAVVVGAPARIVRFRYTPDQIGRLNRICWWDWTDDQIRERFDDFYLPIEEFLSKWDPQ